jgi:hypothetical protein
MSLHAEASSSFQLTPTRGGIQSRHTNWKITHAGVMAYIHMYPTVMLLNFLSAHRSCMVGLQSIHVCTTTVHPAATKFNVCSMHIELTTSSCDLKSPVGLGHNLQIDSKSNVPSMRGGLC